MKSSAKFFLYSSVTVICWYLTYKYAIQEQSSSLKVLIIIFCLVYPYYRLITGAIRRSNTIHLVDYPLMCLITALILLVFKGGLL